MKRASDFCKDGTDCLSRRPLQSTSSSLSDVKETPSTSRCSLTTRNMIVSGVGELDMATIPHPSRLFGTKTVWRSFAQSIFRAHFGTHRRRPGTTARSSSPIYSLIYLILLQPYSKHVSIARAHSYVCCNRTAFHPICPSSQAIRKCLIRGILQRKTRSEQVQLERKERTLSGAESTSHP